MKKLTVKLMAMLMALLFVMCGCAYNAHADVHDDGNDVVERQISSPVLFAPGEATLGTETENDSELNMQQQESAADDGEDETSEPDETEIVPGGKGDESVSDKPEVSEEVESVQEPEKQAETNQQPEQEEAPVADAEEDDNVSSSVRVDDATVSEAESETENVVEQLKAEPQKVCVYCTEPGHDMAACAVKAADEAPCSYCGAEDHKVDTCKLKKADEFDVGYWVQYAKDYAVNVGLKLDPTMTKENSSWDAPIPATYRSKYIADDVQSRMNTYVQYIEWYGTAGIVWVEARPDGPYEWDLFVYYG